MPLDNPNEQFYWVDTNDTVIGSISRQDAHKDKSKIHRAVNIVVANSQHQILLQKRSMRKDKYPGYWTVSASGHVEYGSTYEQTATKELREEIGLSIPLQQVTQFIVHMPTETEMIGVFAGQAPEITTFLVDPIEVDQVKWVKMSDIASFARHHKLTLPALQTFRTLGYLKE